jgi:hypothetical protein
MRQSSYLVLGVVRSAPRCRRLRFSSLSFALSRTRRSGKFPLLSTKPANAFTRFLRQSSLLGSLIARRLPFRCRFAARNALLSNQGFKPRRLEFFG